MKKQKIQMLVVVILLVICVVAYIFISKNAGKLDSTENDGPNASMGNVTESVLETETESLNIFMVPVLSVMAHTSVLKYSTTSKMMPMMARICFPFFI